MKDVNDAEGDHEISYFLAYWQEETMSRRAKRVIAGQNDELKHVGVYLLIPSTSASGGLGSPSSSGGVC